jgi:hypothetical protein
MSEVAVKGMNEETRGFWSRFLPRDERVILVMIVAAIFAILVLPPVVWLKRAFGRARLIPLSLPLAAHCLRFSLVA